MERRWQTCDEGRQNFNTGRTFFSFGFFKLTVTPRSPGFNFLGEAAGTMVVPIGFQIRVAENPYCARLRRRGGVRGLADESDVA